MKKLRQEINHHRYLYHVKDRQEISDAALDSLKRELAELEARFPDLITPDSPTQRVGGEPLPEFKQVRHAAPMLSLQDAFTREELQEWEERNRKVVREDFDYFVEPKIDGVAVSLIYEDGRLRRAVTRGDGRVGEDVTHNIRTIEAVPLKLRRKVSGRVEVRGEVYILKNDFQKMNADRQRKQEPPFANPRNVAAGSIRQLDPQVAASRPLRFFAWEITDGISLKTRRQEYEKLRELGFPVPPDGCLLSSVDEAAEYLAKEGEIRKKRPFLVDGAVVKINRLETARRLGIVGKAPRGSTAFKFAAEEATTVVEKISVQVGRTGTLTPVALLKPVTVAGTTVSRATLHNADEIRRKDVRKGDTVIVRKAGDIIPEVVKVLPALRPSRSRPFSLPRKCPVCGSPVRRDKGGVAVRCTNRQCFPRQRERIIHAVGRGGFDLDGLGDKIVEQLLQEGLIKDAPDLWNLKEGDLKPLERFAEKSASKLIKEIRANKEISLARFLTALGIPHVGVVTAQDMVREFKTLDSTLKATREDLQSIDGIGEKVARGITDFLHSQPTRKLIEKYRRAGIKVKKAASAGSLSGRTFVFTGSMPEMTREEAKQRVQTLGGKTATAVGEKVDYVVAGEKAGSKEKKARELGVTVLTPAQFKKMLKES